MLLQRSWQRKAYAREAPESDGDCCCAGGISDSLTELKFTPIQNAKAIRLNIDTCEAVWLGVEENDIETLKGLPEFEQAVTICWVRS